MNTRRSELIDPNLLPSRDNFLLFIPDSYLLKLLLSQVRWFLRMFFLWVVLWYKYYINRLYILSGEWHVCKASEVGIMFLHFLVSVDQSLVVCFKPPIQSLMLISYYQLVDFIKLFTSLRFRKYFIARWRTFRDLFRAVCRCMYRKLTKEDNCVEMGGSRRLWKLNAKIPDIFSISNVNSHSRDRIPQIVPHSSKPQCGSRKNPKMF